MVMDSAAHCNAVLFPPIVAASGCFGYVGCHVVAFLQCAMHYVRASYRYIRSTVNNFVDWPHIGAVMHYRGYVEPRDGAVSVLLSSQQEAVACVRCIQKESHCSEG
jgi:hypothetical protein